MNYNKFFVKAKEEGLEALELVITKSSQLSFSLFKYKYPIIASKPEDIL